MEIKLKNIDETFANIYVNLSKSDYEANYEKKLKEYGKKASIKGFRQGHVPTALVKKMYGPSVLADEINNLLSETIKNYIKEQNLKIIGEPLPVDSGQTYDWTNPSDFDFTYEIGLIPPFDVKIDSIKIEKLEIKTDKTQLDETLDNIKKQFAKIEKPEVSELGDFLNGKLSQIDGSFNEDVMLPTNQLKSQKELFLSRKKDEVVTFDIQKVFDNDAALIGHFTGLKKEEAEKLIGNFELKITDITRSVPSELNQELFDKVFGIGMVKTEEEFNSKVEERVKENYERESQNLLSRNLMDDIILKTNLNLPVEFLKKWLKVTNPNMSLEEIDQSIHDYVHDLKWTLIRNKLAEERSLKVENEEVVESSRAKLLSQLNMTTLNPDLESQFNQWADNYLRENNGQNYIKEYENLLTIKVLNEIKNEIKISEKKVTLEKFNEIASELV